MEELKFYEDKMNKTLDVLLSDYGTIRAGRANPHVLDKIKVDYYGTPTPLQQVGNVSVPVIDLIYHGSLCEQGELNFRVPVPLEGTAAKAKFQASYPPAPRPDMIVITTPMGMSRIPIRYRTRLTKRLCLTWISPFIFHKQP